MRITTFILNFHHREINDRFNKSRFFPEILIMIMNIHNSVLLNAKLRI